MKWRRIPERVRTVILYAPIPLLMVIYSPFTAWIIFVLLAVIATLEWRSMILKKREQFYTAYTQIVIIGVIGSMVCALFLPWLAFVIPPFVTLLVYSAERRSMRLDLTLANIVPSYVAILAYILRSSDDGLALFGLVLVVTISSDTAAYIVGRAIGFHKLAPQISPNKTWEGAIGGWMATLLFGWIYCTYFLPSFNALSFWKEMLIFWVLAVAGQLGDLGESAVKRKFKVKDSSQIFPGHGGVMDRFDSFSTVIVALYLMIFIFNL